MALNIECRGQYEIICGELTEEMPSLLAKKMTPVSVAEIWRQQSKIYGKRKSIPPVHPGQFWLQRSYYTGDGFLRHPDGKGKIILDAQYLRELTPQSRLSKKAVRIPDGFYESLDGLELSKHDLQRLEKQGYYSRVSPLEVLCCLARENKSLVDETARLLTQHTRAREEGILRIYFGEASKSTVLGYLWGVQRFYEGGQVQCVGPGVLGYIMTAPQLSPK